MFSTDIYVIVITVHKRSLGQGYMFTGVSVHRGVGWACLVLGGGACSAGVSAPRGCLLRGGSAPRVVYSMGSAPEGSAPGGACSGGIWSGGYLVETPTRRPLLRAVRILLECILVMLIDLLAFYMRRIIIVHFKPHGSWCHVLWGKERNSCVLGKVDRLQNEH